MTPLKVYVVDTALIPAAESIVEITRKMVGGYDYPVEIEPVNFPHPYNYITANPVNLNTWNTGTISTGTTYSTPSNTWSYGTSTSNVNTTPYNYTINVGTSASVSVGATLSPDQVPTNEVFEKMLIASIKQLNEAYNLGRLHGFVQGKEEGALAEHKATKDAMDTEILETEKDDWCEVTAKMS